jgi:hypothetical protein
MSGLNLTSQFLEKLITLEDYTQLVFLDLSNNSLEYFNFQLSDLYTLKFIILANNNLKIFDFNTIPPFFYHLDISFNQIAFMNYNYLDFSTSSISLKNNNLSAIDDILMYYFFQSSELDLSGNRLQATNKDLNQGETYSLNIRVLYLNLSNNNLKDIGNIFTPDWFYQFLPTVTLDLSNNRFKSLNFSFESLVQLQNLYLQRNAIMFIKEDLFDLLNHLIQLDLSYNRLSLGLLSMVI